MLPDEKPIRWYILLACTVLSGASNIFLSSSFTSGFWHFLFVILGICYLLVSWALLDGIKNAHQWAQNVYLVSAAFAVVGAFGFIPPSLQEIAIGNQLRSLGVSCLYNQELQLHRKIVFYFDFIWDACFLIAFSRRKIAVWYEPVRRGYYISGE